VSSDQKTGTPLGHFISDKQGRWHFVPEVGVLLSQEDLVDIVSHITQLNKRKRDPK